MPGNKPTKKTKPPMPIAKPSLFYYLCENCGTGQYKTVKAEWGDPYLCPLCHGYMKLQKDTK